MISKIKKLYKNSKFFEFVDKAENKYYQKKLTNHNFTLLTPNCMAGLIYHRLGEKFNSPTIDTAMQTHDFMLLVNDLDYYLSKDIVQDADNDFDYPVGVIFGDSEHEDIRVNFVHYDTFEYARKKWNERKTRIVKDNLYIIVCDIGNNFEPNVEKAGFIADEDSMLFEKARCNNKIMLTRDKNRMQKYSRYIEPMYNKPYPLTYMNRDIFGLNGFEKYFDFVSFINKK